MGNILNARRDCTLGQLFLAWFLFLDGGCCLIISNLGYVAMIEHRALERIAINQIALLYVDGIRGCHPCLVENFHGDGAMLHSSTHHTAASKFDLSLDGFKTTKHVVWWGGTEIPAASLCRSKRRPRSGRGGIELQ